MLCGSTQEENIYASACCVLPLSEPAKSVSQSPTLSPPPPSLSQCLCVSVQTLAYVGRMLSAPTSSTTGLPRSPTTAAAAAAVAAADWLVRFSSPGGSPDGSPEREATRCTGSRERDRGDLRLSAQGNGKKRAIPNGAIFWISHRHESGSQPAAANPGPTLLSLAKACFKQHALGVTRGSTYSKEAAVASV